jgi:intein/homing endonuclease
MNRKEQVDFIADNYIMYTNHISNRRIRHDFFNSISTEVQAYLLGFYAADGSIDEKRKTFRVHVQTQDSEIIYLYKDLISPDARTFTRNDGTTVGRNGMLIQGHGSFGVDITSAKLCQSLVNLGIGYRKTYVDFHIPDIPDNLIRHFIRGYFDGDGSIIGWVAKEINKSDRFRYKFDICSKTSGILLDIQKFFSNHNIKTNINYIKRDDMYRISTSSKVEVNKIYHLLYDDSNFRLSRKFNKFNHYVNTEVTQLIAEHRNAQEVSVNESNNLPKSAEHPLKDENVR